MQLEEYIELMQKVTEFAKRIGLNTEGLYSEHYNLITDELWVLSVSTRTNFFASQILFDDDNLGFDEKMRLNSDIIYGSKDEIEAYKKKAEAKGAEIFSKKSAVWGVWCPLIRPSPEFLNLSQVEQVEYTIHEAFHLSKKDEHIGGSLNLAQYEESAALVAGYIGAIEYFRNTALEEDARRLCDTKLGAMNKMLDYFNKLQYIYHERMSDEHLTEERVIELTDPIRNEAINEIGTSLGIPVNNAFFRYYFYFCQGIPSRIDKIHDIPDIVGAMDELRKFRGRSHEYHPEIFEEVPNLNYTGKITEKLSFLGT